MNTAEKQENSRDKRKIKTAAIIMLIRLTPLWLILAAIITVSVLFLPLFGKPLIQLTTVEDNSVSDLMLESISDVYKFHTVEYLYKVVFPFDYDIPGVSEWQIFRKISSHLNSNPASFLSPAEQALLKSAELAKRNRLKIYAPDYQFLVATVIIRAGFNLQGTGLEPGSVISPSDRQRLITLSSVKKNNKTVRVAIVTLPPTIISDIEIEDPIRDKYPFPDIGLDPKGWKEISQFIQEQSQERAVKEGILIKAQENAQNFIRELLAAAGVDEVSFK